ncbi:MAG: CcmD family protein [Candidatus Dadabacteria bacterium]|nr:MAG: CcmD family protein [Candidatus Dadabacteria bacterium]
MTSAVDTFPSLFWGYTVIWMLLAAYLFWLGRRVRKLEEKKEN